LTEKTMVWVEKVLERGMTPLRKFTYIAVTVLFGSQVIVVFAQVIWRFVFDSPFSWSEELARYLQVWLILLMSAVCIRKGRHLAVDYVTHNLSFELQRVFKLISLLAILAYVIVVIVFGIKMIAVAGAQKTPAMQIPIGIIYLAFPITGTFMFLETLVAFVKVVNAQTVTELNQLQRTKEGNLRKSG